MLKANDKKFISPSSFGSFIVTKYWYFEYADSIVRSVYKNQVFSKNFLGLGGDY